MIRGWQHIHEEHVSIGPDGKPVRNVYTLRRELNEEQATELMKEHEALFAPMERMFEEMDRFMDGMFGRMGGTLRRKPGGR